MNIEPLVRRLEQLKKNSDVEFFLMCRESQMDADYMIIDENVIEYQTIETELKNALIDEINFRSSDILNEVNLRDFSLIEIKEQLNQLAYKHYASRKPIEIERDRLIYWQNHNYYNQYELVDKFKNIKEIDAERKIFKEQLQYEIINEFKIIFIEELKLNKLQPLLLTGYSLDFYFLKNRANEYYQTRSKDIIERDIYGYVNLDSYNHCLMISLKKAIEFIQTQSKEDTIQLYLDFLRNKLSITNFEKYNGDMYNDIHEYKESLINNRTITKIEDDTYKLINISNYSEWAEYAMKSIKIEFPKVFEVEEYVDDYDDYEDYQTIRFINSKYNKYGGYNGFDDDTIDDAFEGDPSNTWNLD
jgi:hypothetical protein